VNIRNAKPIGFYICILLIGMAGCRSISSPRLPAPSNRDEAWVQDLTYLKETFPRHNKSFDGDSLAAFNGIMGKALDSVPELTNNEIYVQLLRAVATPGDRHTGINFMPSSRKLRRLPIRFYWFSDGLYVIRAAAEHADLLGARITEIGGVRPEVLVSRMRDLVSGSDSALRYDSIYYLSSPDFLHGLGVIKDPDSVTLRLETLDGSVVSRGLDTMPMGEAIWGYESWRELSPLSTESMDATDFEHVLENVSLPYYLSDPNRAAFGRIIAGGSVLYVQINQNTNLNSKMSEVAEQVKELFRSTSIDSVIVDLRFNTGGNLLLTTELVKGIPEWHTGSGNIYIIVGGPTFSAGIVTAARLKYYAGDRAVVVGEPASDGLQFWAETRFFTLPNSNIRLYAAYRYHNWEDTNYDRNKPHFWLMRQVGVPAGDLSIDMPVEMSFADYLSGRDTILEAILRQAQVR
jgi:hypothetical protein